MHVRDTKFTELFDEAFTDSKRNVNASAFRSANTNAYVERFIQSLQQECLEDFFVFGKHTSINFAWSTASIITEAHQSLENLVLPTANIKRSNKSRKQSPQPQSIPLSSIRCKERLGAC